MDTHKDSRFRELNPPFRAMLCSPIVGRGRKTIGVFHALAFDRPVAFSFRHQKKLEDYGKKLGALLIAEKWEESEQPPPPPKPKRPSLVLPQISEMPDLPDVSGWPLQRVGLGVVSLLFLVGLVGLFSRCGGQEPGRTPSPPVVSGQPAQKQPAQPPEPKEGELLVQGKLIDPKMQAIPSTEVKKGSMVVWLEREKAVIPGQQVKTDWGGGFSVVVPTTARKPQGSVDIRVTVPGYEPDKYRARIHNGRAKVGNIVLLPAKKLR